MKILHTITSINRGGAENHLFELISGQIKQGHEVFVAYLKGDGYWHKPLMTLGVHTVNLGLLFYGDLNPILKLRTLIKTINPNIVHTHMPPAELYTSLALIGNRSNLPLIITKHNDEPFYKLFGQSFLARKIAKKAQHIIAISNSVKNNVCLSDLKCSSDKVSTIYYGIDPIPYETVDNNVIQELRHAWSVSKDTYIIGTVARLVPQKALHILLEGFSICLKQRYLAKLVIVGQGYLELDLKRKADSLGIQDYVIWAGYREDIPVVMNALDLFVLTSKYEGFGLVLLEAMAAAKPVVATNVSAIPEVIKDQITGLLVTPEDPQELSKALLFFENGSARKQFGYMGKKRVSDQFTLERMFLKTQKVYEQSLENAVQ